MDTYKLQNKKGGGEKLFIIPETPLTHSHTHKHRSNQYKEGRNEN